MCRQQHPYVPTTPPTPRETHTHARVCTHTRHLHARIPYMHTGEDNTRTRLHPCGTGARTGPGTKRCHRQPDTGPGPSQTPHSRQPDNGRDDRRRHNGYHDRARNGVNPAPREQNRVARVCVRACTGARALGWVRTGLRVRGCGVFGFFCARRGACSGFCDGVVRAGVFVRHRGRARRLPWGSRPNRSRLLPAVLLPGSSLGLSSPSPTVESPEAGLQGWETPWGWGCCRDGDITGMGTSRTPLCWRGRGQDEPQGLLTGRGPGAPGCLGSPRTPQAQLSPLGNPWVGTPGCPAPCCTQAGALSPP